MTEEIFYESRKAYIESDITTHWMLSRMGWIATKLFNTALWHSRDRWKKTGKIPNKKALQRIVFESPYHSYLPAHTYQHPSHEVSGSYKSWFEKRKTDVTAHPPGFRNKKRISSLTFTQYGFHIIDKNTIGLVLTDEFKDEFSYPYKRLKLKLRWITSLPKGSIIQQIEIVPEDDHFVLHAKLKLPEPQWKTTGQSSFIDLGKVVPIVSVDEKDNIDMYKGGEINSTIRYFNKETARVQSEVMGRTNGKKKWSKSLTRMTGRRVHQVDQALHGMVNHYVNLCIQRNVKEVYVGDLKGIKKQKDGTGKDWNNISQQSWQQFPIRKLVTLLRYKLARYGIRLREENERGTSTGRCSLCGCTDKSKLHRVHRGLFYCENCKKYQHADINGAGNFRYLLTKICWSSGRNLARPLVYHWDGHRWHIPSMVI